MSNQAITWAFGQQGLTTVEKFLLVALANDAQKCGVAFTGQETLAVDIAAKRETVSRNLRKLEVRGLLVRRQRRRFNGSRTSDWIVLAPNAADRGAMSDANPEEYPAEIAQLASRERRSRDAGSHEEASRERRSRDAGSRESRSRDPDGASHVTQTGGPDPLEKPSVNTPSAAQKSPKEPSEGALQVLDLHGGIWGLAPKSASQHGVRQLQAAEWLAANVGAEQLAVVLQWARRHRFWSGRASKILVVRSEWAALLAQYETAQQGAEQDSSHHRVRERRHDALRRMMGAPAVEREEVAGGVG